MSQRARRTTALGSVTSLVLALLAPACDSRNTCEPAEGFALVLKPRSGTTQDAEKIRSPVEAISGVKLVIATDEVGIFIPSREEKAFTDAKTKALQHTEPVGLELYGEARAKIDATCTIHLENENHAVRPSNAGR